MADGDGVARLLLRRERLPLLEVVEPSPKAARLLGRQALGELVHVVEALYLLYHGAAVVEEPGGRRVSFEELVAIYSESNPYAWVEFEVFYDLRRRGRLVAVGPRPHTLLVRRSKKSGGYSVYLLVMEESRAVPLSMLLGFVEEALKNGWEPMLAIVDRYGDIIYYNVTSFRPRRLRQPPALAGLEPHAAGRG